MSYHFWFWHTVRMASHLGFVRGVERVLEGAERLGISTTTRHDADDAGQNDTDGLPWPERLLDAEASVVRDAMRARKAWKDELRELNQTLSGIGHDLQKLLSECQELVLFGSRAAGLEGPDSDWNLLCVGYGKTRRTKHVDLVWVRPEDLTDPEWLGTELAAHVAKYGRWIKGEGRWRAESYVSEASLERKRRAIRIRLRVLWRHQDELPARLRAKYVDKLRLNVVRCWFLAQGKPSPPRQILEEHWFDDWRSVAEAAGVPVGPLYALIEMEKGAWARVCCLVGWVALRAGNWKLIFSLLEQVSKDPLLAEYSAGNALWLGGNIGALVFQAIKEPDPTKIGKLVQELLYKETK